VPEISEITLTKIERDKLAADVAYYHYADSAFFDQLFPVVFGIRARLNNTECALSKSDKEVRNELAKLKSISDGTRV
jgi:hypothetical protein